MCDICKSKLNEKYIDAARNAIALMFLETAVYDLSLSEEEARDVFYRQLYETQCREEYERQNGTLGQNDSTHNPDREIL